MWGQFSKYKPLGGLYLEGRFNGGFFASPVWGAYFWRGLYTEGLIFGILRYFLLTLCEEKFPNSWPWNILFTLLHHDFNNPGYTLRQFSSVQLLLNVTVECQPLEEVQCTLPYWPLLVHVLGNLVPAFYEASQVIPGPSNPWSCSLRQSH